RAARVQGRLDLLVAGLDDELRRGGPRQRWWRQPAGHSVSGHRAEQQYLSLAQPAWDSHQRLLAVRRTAARRNREGVRERQESRHVRRGDSQSEAQLQEPTEHDRALIAGVSQPLRILLLSAVPLR